MHIPYRRLINCLGKVIEFTTRGMAALSGMSEGGRGLSRRMDFGRPNFGLSIAQWTWLAELARIGQHAIGRVRARERCLEGVIMS